MLLWLTLFPYVFTIAETNHGNQRLPVEGQEEGRQVGADQEKHWQHQVQGALFQVPVHPCYHRQGKGRETEAVFAPR